jgi:hypothetical protein
MAHNIIEATVISQDLVGAPEDISIKTEVKTGTDHLIEARIILGFEERHTPDVVSDEATMREVTLTDGSPGYLLTPTDTDDSDAVDEEEYVSIRARKTWRALR